MEMHEQGYMPPVSRGPSVGVVVFLALLFGLVGGAGGGLLMIWANQRGFMQSPASSGSAPVESAMPSGAHYNSSPQSFAQVAKKLNASVVNINTRSRQENPYALFFGQNPQQEVQGLGTGVIVSSDGYILTNYHVVGEANDIRVTVTLPSEKHEYPAQLIGGDKQEDLALIKIDPKGLRLQPVVFGDSDNLMPGEWVMAIGNPFGFEHTVSVGVVSALNRSLPVEDTVTLKRMIQTDASINPGNSGGPLVNLNGEVIGINSAIFVGGGGGQPQAKGLGFAIPSNRAKKVMEMFRSHKAVQHPYIGIAYDAITDQLSHDQRLPVKTGVMVSAVLPDSPAAKAKIQKNDIILAADGKELKDRNALSDYINNQDVGKAVTLDIMRWDDSTAIWKKSSVRVTIENKPVDFEKKMKSQGQPNSGGQGGPSGPGGQGGPDGQPQQPQQQQPNGGTFPFPWPF